MGTQKKKCYEERRIGNVDCTRMYKNIITSVKIDGKQSKKFEVKVGVN